MANKFRKCLKAGAYVAAYCAELAAVTYLSTKMSEKWDEGEISTARYAAESTALTIGALATYIPIWLFGTDAVADAVDEFTSSDDELEFPEE